jgi:Vitamin K-dependent gamma-carboxylase
MLHEAILETSAQEKNWQRMWLRAIPYSLAYLLLLIAAYYWVRHSTPNEDYFFWKQRFIGRAFLGCLAAHLAWLMYRHRALWRYKWQLFFHKKQSPHALAAARILILGELTFDLLAHAQTRWAPFAALPSDARVSLPFTGWLLPHLPISPELYQFACISATVLGVMALLGIFTRPALIALIPLTIYVIGVPQFFGKLNHYQFFVWATIILAFTPCNAVWSLDALLNRLRGVRIDRRPSIYFGLGIRWLMLTLGGIYFFSGFHKLYDAGFYWALSDNPVNLMRVEWLEEFQQLPAFRADHWPILCSMGAIATIAFEMAYPFLLLSRRAQKYLALSAIAFHNLTGYFLQIDFTILKTAHLPYFDLERVCIWLGRMRYPILAIVLTLVAWRLLAGFVGVSLPFHYVIWAAILTTVVLFIPGRWRVKAMQSLRLALWQPRTRAQWLHRERKWLRASLISGAILLGLNSFCGLFGIHSWPFSAYPSYSFVRQSTISYAWFLPVTAQGEALDLDTEAQKIQFRKEHILPMTEAVVSNWRYDPPALTGSVERCWGRWMLEVPRLMDAVRAQVVVREYPIDPDRYGEIVSETHLGEMRLQLGKWHYIADSLLNSPPKSP